MGPGNKALTGNVDTPFPGGARTPRENCVIRMASLSGPAGKSEHRIARALVDVSGEGVEPELAVQELCG